MQYTSCYQSPIGPILLAADDTGITGLWFEGQQHYAQGLDSGCSSRETPILQQCKRWLDLYFSGEEPDFHVPLHPVGTAFQLAVWAQLCQIPYGATTTYGSIAKALGKPRATQAVGAAVGRNRISLLIPCHRVLGARGALTGYAGGMDRKQFLLTLEGISK